MDQDLGGLVGGLVGELGTGIRACGTVLPLHPEGRICAGGKAGSSVEAIFSRTMKVLSIALPTPDLLLISYYELLILFSNILRL